MTCPRCSTELPTGAAFCHRCGADAVWANATDGGRRHSYAAQPGEGVVSFNVVSALMPLATEQAPQTYRFALAAGGAIPLIAVLLGWLPFAFGAAALLVPAVYVLYLYDVNEWEDQPLRVLVGTVLATAVLALVWTWIWHGSLLPDDNLALHRSGSWSAPTVLVACVLAPLVGEALRQLGPLALSRRPQFDDLIDAVTFAVAAGATWAAVETLVVNRSLILGGFQGGRDVDTAHWWLTLAVAGLLKPIVYGSASALALAAFSGVGPGFRGFRGAYWRALAETLAIVVCFQLGQYAADRLGGRSGSVAALVVAAAVAGYAIIRVRMVLHTALLEGALEAARNDGAAQHATSGEAYCGHCDMPLLDSAAFCSACGTSTRTVPKDRRQWNQDADNHLPTALTTPGAAR